MKALIYNAESGAGRIIVTGPEDQISAQCLSGEGYYPNPPEGTTHIIDGKPAALAPEVTREQAVMRIRVERNRRISETDWTQLPDVPLNATAKGAWGAYRQQLRDFTETCDPYNPVWPTPP